MKRGYAQGFVGGVLLSVSMLMIMGSAFATIGSRTLTADYNNIKIELNGEMITPQDAQGNPVEPFAVNGTTYLPVRAVGNALGLSVEWDGATNTVKLTGGQQDPSEGILYYPNSRIPMLENLISGHYTYNHQSEDGDGIYAYPVSQLPASSEFQITDYIEFLGEQGFEYITSNGNGFAMKNRAIDEGLLIEVNGDIETYGRYLSSEPEVLIFVFANLE